MTRYFELLEINKGAGLQEIQHSYRRLVKRYHPDINKNPDAHEKFCEITEAYEFLMHHWPRQSGSYEDHLQTETFERFRRDTQEKAKQQARMRYERFRKQHEAFRESGLNDIALILNFSGRMIGLALFLFLFLTPIVTTMIYHWTWVVLALIMWPFAGILGWYIYDRRKSYFITGSIYYTPKRIAKLYTHLHPSDELCFYCKYCHANSLAYKVELFRLKDVRLRRGNDHPIRPII
jgi:hypothetical protein